MAGRETTDGLCPALDEHTRPHWLLENFVFDHAAELVLMFQEHQIVDPAEAIPPILAQLDMVEAKSLS